MEKEAEMKPWYRSKTIWAQVVAAVVWGAEQAQLVQVIPQEYAGYLFFGLLILNTVLRLLTREPIKRSLK